MTDTISCTFDSAHTFTCEVDLGPDPAPTAASTSAPSPAAAAPAPDPAVAQLVTSYKTSTLPGPNVPLVTPHALEQCVSSEIGMGLAFAVPTGLGLIAALKTGLDEMKCLSDQQDVTAIPLAQKEGAADCAASGGTVTSVDGYTTYCKVH